MERSMIQPQQERESSPSPGGEGQGLATTTESSPDRAALLAQADTLRAEGRLAEAVQLYLKAIEIPGTPQEIAPIYSLLGDISFERQDYQLAVVAYRQAVSLHPTKEHRQLYDMSLDARMRTPISQTARAELPLSVFGVSILRSLTTNAKFLIPVVDNTPSFLFGKRVSLKSVYTLTSIALLTSVLSWFAIAQPLRRQPATPTIVIPTEAQRVPTDNISIELPPLEPLSGGEKVQLPERAIFRHYTPNRQRADDVPPPAPLVEEESNQSDLPAGP